ncbi:MAG: hypothetical protein GKS06_17520 [Acidobacteria bacterium]|nr:hypothetical protein [Acidobacteriota bacterium]
MLERLFRIQEAGTSVRTEVLAGATTFLTMAYIIFVQPAVLSGALTGTPTGMDFASVTAATCLSAAFASVLMGLVGRYPIALAPGMGQNFFRRHHHSGGRSGRTPGTVACGSRCRSRLWNHVPGVDPQRCSRTGDAGHEPFPEERRRCRDRDLHRLHRAAERHRRSQGPGHRRHAESQRRVAGRHDLLSWSSRDGNPARAEGSRRVVARHGERTRRGFGCTGPGARYWRGVASGNAVPARRVFAGRSAYASRNSFSVRYRRSAFSSVDPLGDSRALHGRLRHDGNARWGFAARRPAP